MDTVSLIIPIYNSSKYLNKCLNSVINQTYPDLEIICINDGSNDNSIEILDKYARLDDRIIVINIENKGVSNARNIGIKEAKGKYITFLDSDDYLEKNCIDTLVKDIRQFGVDVVRGNYNIVNNKDKRIGENILGNKSEICPSKILKDDILKGEKNAFVWLLLCKTEIIKNIKFNDKLSLMEDVIFYMELLNKIDKIFLERKCLYNYVINFNSITRDSERIEKNIKEVQIFNKEIKKYINNEEKIIANSGNTNYIIQLLSSIKNHKYRKRKEIYQDVFESEEYREIFKNIDKKKYVKKYVRLLLNFGMKKMYLILDILFKIKRSIFRIKKFCCKI